MNQPAKFQLPTELSNQLRRVEDFVDKLKSVRTEMSEFREKMAARPQQPIRAAKKSREKSPA